MEFVALINVVSAGLSLVTDLAALIDVVVVELSLVMELVV